MGATAAVSPKWVSGYFTAALIVFIASFLILPTAKMVNNVYYVLLALPALWCLITHRRSVFLAPSPDFALWSALLLWFALVGFWSGDAQHYKHLLYVALFIVIVTRLADPAPLRQGWFARGMFWALIAYVLGSALIYWTIGRYGVGERVLWLPARMTGPIYTSMWISCCFALAVPVWLNERRWAEAIAALLLAVFCMGFILQSRSGLVAFVVVMAGIGCYQALRSRRLVLYLAASAALGIALVTVAAITVPEVGQLFARADAGRIRLWNIMLSEWMDCGLLLGCGLEHKTKQLLLSGRTIDHPHSVFLSMGVFGGIVALILFVALMALVLHSAWQKRDPWGLYLVTALVGLNFDGSKLIGNPDELWLLVLLPACLIGNRYCTGGAASRQA